MLSDFIKLIRVNLSLTFLITQTDTYEIVQNGEKLAAQFNFASLHALENIDKFSKMNFLSYMSGLVKKRARTWTEKLMNSSNIRWKKRYLLLTNMGLFEYSSTYFDKPK